MVRHRIRTDNSNPLDLFTCTLVSSNRRTHLNMFTQLHRLHCGCFSVLSRRITNMVYYRVWSSWRLLFHLHHLPWEHWFCYIISDDQMFRNHFSIVTTEVLDGEVVWQMRTQPTKKLWPLRNWCFEEICGSINRDRPVPPSQTGQETLAVSLNELFLETQGENVPPHAYTECMEAQTECQNIAETHHETSVSISVSTK